MDYRLQIRYFDTQHTLTQTIAPDELASWVDYLNSCEFTLTYVGLIEVTT